MVLDKTSECDDWEAWESMIMGLLYHAEPWPALLLLWGCFVKQTAKGGVYWRALLSCDFPSTKLDAAKFQRWSAAQRVGFGLSILGCCCCSCVTFISCCFKSKENTRNGHLSIQISPSVSGFSPSTISVPVCVKTTALIAFSAVELILSFECSLCSHLSVFTNIREHIYMIPVMKIWIISH